MTDITAVPYRTPACDEHLPDNDSDECPWCRIAELERKEPCNECPYMDVIPPAPAKIIEDLQQRIDKLEDKLDRCTNPKQHWW